MADVFPDRLKSSLGSLKENGDLKAKVDVPADHQFVGLDAYKQAMDCLKPGDVAVFATPPAFRWVNFQYAVQKGLNVFMEKPVTVDGPTSKRMFELGKKASEKKLKVGVGLMSRHSRALQEVAKRVHDGELGEIILQRGYRMHGPIGWFFGWDAIVRGVGERAPSALAAVEAAYARGENDEFVRPTVVEGVDGTLRDGDPIVHCNFRADRARQLTHALADPSFADFDRSAGGRPAPRDVLVVTMTEYEEGLPVAIAFPPEKVPSLAGAFSAAGWSQLHVAETEKYAHVTYFFNGGREAPWPGEERQLVPSPRVATYDLQPAMSAPGVTDALVGAIGSGAFDFIVANYAVARHRAGEDSQPDSAE